MIKIGFNTPLLDVRGTCVSLYDYAHYNEVHLGNVSVVLTPKDADHDDMAYRKFSNRFNVVMYSDLADMDRLLQEHGCDILYSIKYGKNDGILSKVVKNAVHCVFDLSEPHGDAYAAVSSTLAAKFGHPDHVPHMVGLRPSRLRDNMRKQLGIPEDARVFGRHGGRDTFDLDVAKNAIKRAVRDHSDIYFLFVNTPVFDSHPRILFMDKIVDMDEKNRFICSCDAMIHAQSLGETFGLSIGEFSVNNKPIVTYGGPVWNDNYKKILKDGAIYYHDEEECYQAITLFRPEDHANNDNNCYRDFTPEKVMRIFRDVFIIPLVGTQLPAPEPKQ